MTIRYAARRSSLSSFITLVAAIAVVAVVISLAAYAQSNDTFELPEQIGQSEDGNISIEKLELPNFSQTTDVMINPISTGIDPQPANVMQSEGGHDVCGPEFSDWERQRSGVDCSGINLAGPTLPNSQTGLPIATHPLQRSGVNEVFSTLSLGNGIPATVILQQTGDGEEISITPTITADGHVTNDLLLKPSETKAKDDGVLESLGLGPDVPATVILQK